MGQKDGEIDCTILSTCFVPIRQWFTSIRSFFFYYPTSLFPFFYSWCRRLTLVTTHSYWSFPFTIFFPVIFFVLKDWAVLLLFIFVFFPTSKHTLTLTLTLTHTLPTLSSSPPYALTHFSPLSLSIAQISPPIL